MVIIFLLLTIWTVAVASLSISLPINAQVPPVARVNHSFDFTFAASTFASSGGTTSYQISNSPAWLQLDSASRTFSGTPQQQDVGSFVFDLEANDGSDSCTMHVTFVVSSDAGPGLGVSVSRQMSLNAAFSSPNIILVPHSTALSLSFDHDTFTNTNENTAYYALSANNTPLPSWIYFDPSSLSFTGTAPLATSLSELPQGYTIELAASDVIGFAGASTTFQVVVESHLFTFGSNSHAINVTAGSSVTYTGLQSDLYLNGSPANISAIEQVVANPPTWLSLDTTTLILSGTAPENVAQQTFTINVTDIYGDAATTLVSLQVGQNSTDASGSGGGLFTLPTTVYTGNGSDFVYDLHKSLQDPNAAVSVDLGSTWTWLHYDSGSLRLEGQVPHDSKQQTYTVGVKASSGGRTQSQVLSIAVTQAASPSVTMSSKGSSTSTASDATSSKPAPGVSIEQDRRWIALVVVLPVLVLLSALAFIACCMCRRRRKRAKWYCDSMNSSSNDVRKGSALTHEEERKESETAEMSGALSADPKERPLRISKPPTIDIAGLWKTASSNRNSRFRSSRTSSNDDYRASKADSWHRYTMDLNARTASRVIGEKDAISEEQGSTTSNGVPRTPEQAARASRPSADLQVSPKRGHSVKHRKSSNISLSSAAFFSNQINGFGHGRAFRSQDSGSTIFGTRGIGRRDGSGPPGYGTVQDSWRNLQVLASAVASTNDSRLFSPYSLGPPRRAIAPMGRDRSTIRVVHPPSFSSGRSTLQTLKSSKAASQSRHSERDPLQEFHRQRLLMKNSERALFSAERSSRKSSRNPTLPRTPSHSKGNTRRSTRQSSVLLPDMPFPPSPSLSLHNRKEHADNSHQHSYSGLSSLTSHSSPSQTTQSPHSSSMTHQDIYADSPGIRLPLTGRHTRKSSLLTDDGDSRWESANSDAASMDPRIYSRDMRRASFDGHRPWTSGTHSSRHLSPSPLAETLEREKSRLERFAKGVSRLSYSRAEIGHGPESTDGDSKLSQASLVMLGGDVKGKEIDRRVGLKKGEIGNMSFMGSIRAIADDGDDYTDKGSAFV